MQIKVPTSGYVVLHAWNRLPKNIRNDHLPELVVHLNNTGDKTTPCVTWAYAEYAKRKKN